MCVCTCTIKSVCTHPRVILRKEVCLYAFLCGRVRRGVCVHSLKGTCVMRCVCTHYRVNVCNEQWGVFVRTYPRETHLAMSNGVC